MNYEAKNVAVEVNVVIVFAVVVVVVVAVDGLNSSVREVFFSRDTD